MRLAIINQPGAIWSENQLQSFVSQVENLALDLIVFQTVSQHCISGSVPLFADQHILADGISKIYQDNLGYQISQRMMLNWQTAFLTTHLKTSEHIGKVLFCRNSIERMWFRMLDVQVKLSVIETKQYVLAFISANYLIQVKKQHVIQVHDLLRAQIKPVLLIANKQMQHDLTQMGWFSTARLNHMWVLSDDIFFDFGVEMLTTKIWYVHERSEHESVIIEFNN